MPISFVCKACGRALRVRDELAGRIARCPDCDNRIRIPDDRAEPYEDDELLGGDDAPSEYDDDYDEFANDHSAYTTVPVSPRHARPIEGGGSRRRPVRGRSRPPRGQRFPCPSCGESVSEADARCRYCGERLTGRPRQMQSGHPDEPMHVGDWLVALLCPCIGLAVSIVYLLTGRRKGTMMLGVTVLAMVGLVVLRVAAVALLVGLQR